MTPILAVQMRARELGRIRMGRKGGKGQPDKLDTWRLTSQSRRLLDEAAGLWGGDVSEWADAPTPGQHELVTKTAVLPIIIPPSQDPVSQWMEQWTAGGCTHRCDGSRNTIDDTPCTCNPDEPACKATTRLSVILPDLPDIGVWRLESHGWNAAVELPGTVALIQQASTRGMNLTGSLRIEHRVQKAGGQTRRFIVPVIELDVKLRELVAGGGARQIPGSTQAPPTVPAVTSTADGQETPAAVDESTPLITDAQRRSLFKIAAERGVSKDDVRALVAHIRGDGSDSTDMPVGVYDQVVAAIEAA